MRRIRLMLVSLVLAVPLAAGAGTLTITPNKTAYQVGEEIHLTVVGDSEGATDNGIIGKLRYDDGLVTAQGGQTQNTLTSFDGAISWVTGVLFVDDPPGTSDAFNQVP